jgi:predicted amidophosphoribosyltransferase
VGTEIDFSSQDVVCPLSADSPAFLHSPRHGRGVCDRCFNLTDGFHDCFACSVSPSHLAAIVPISYSVGHEYLHHLLASYKRLRDARAETAATQLGYILDRFLHQHEHCVAAAAGLSGFDVVTTVPSGDRERDKDHPLRRLVGERVDATAPRHERLLIRSDQPVQSRRFDPRRFSPLGRIDGATVLLVDDTWTTGASAQSAAASLRRAGATSVAAVAIGRYVNRDWHDNDRHLERLSFDWDACPACEQRLDSRRVA